VQKSINTGNAQKRNPAMMEWGISVLEDAGSFWGGMILKVRF